MELMKVILDDENLNEAIKQVKRNKGAPGVDKMTVYEIEEYFEKNKESIRQSILKKKYRLQPVKRVYIPKSNGKKRPLGLPWVFMTTNSVITVLVSDLIEVHMMR